MQAAAKQLEFERAAALRDEIQQIRLRVLEQDASVIVGRAAEAAGRGGAAPGAIPGRAGPPRAARARRSSGRARRDRPGVGIEVTSVTVLPADEEPGDAGEEPGVDEGTAADWLPGHPRRARGRRAGWQARWLDRPTWDRTVTPNVKRRTGRRGPRR